MQWLSLSVARIKEYGLLFIYFGMRRNKLQGESTLKVTMLSIDGVSIPWHIFCILLAYERRSFCIFQVSVCLQIKTKTGFIRSNRSIGRNRAKEQSMEQPLAGMAIRQLLSEAQPLFPQEISLRTDSLFVVNRKPDFVA